MDGTTPIGVTEDELTPTEELICELLAARYRLGHLMWTLDRRNLRAVRHLAAYGLVNWKEGIVEKSVLAGLTEKGKRRFLDPGYSSPLVDEAYERGRADAVRYMSV